MEIRPYRPEDQDGVVALWRTAFPDPAPHNDPADQVARKRAVQPELFLVAAESARVVGATLAGYDGHRGWIYSVAVDPAWRRRGIGAALVRRAVDLLGERGCPKVNLQVRAESPEVVRFYESLGFATEERISMGRVLPSGTRTRP